MRWASNDRCGAVVQHVCQGRKCSDLGLMCYMTVQLNCTDSEKFRLPPLALTWKTGLNKILFCVALQIWIILYNTLSSEPRPGLARQSHTFDMTSNFQPVKENDELTVASLQVTLISNVYKSSLEHKDFNPHPKSRSLQG